MANQERSTGEMKSGGKRTDMDRQTDYRRQYEVEFVAQAQALAAD